ncbi:MAG TPA: CoA pyrophosphatase [Actinomycetota bacterium]|nr:CoA pyrophosphatase [Actinomycetota bacterium]
MSDGFRDGLARALAARPGRPVEAEGRAAAVLIPVVAAPRPTLVLTVRTQTLSSHRGQISFPGGSIDDSDPSPEAAALREAHEEIGLDPAAVTVLGRLDAIATYVSGYVVTPVVGWLARRPRLAPSAGEVAEVLEVPVADLTDDIRLDPGFSLGTRTYPTEAWVWNGHVIWGVTARLVRMFLSLLADAGLGNAPADLPAGARW